MATATATATATAAPPTRKLALDNMNPNLIKAEYAVRGAIVARATELEKELQSGNKLPFEKLVYCNIGNPQALGQVGRLPTACLIVPRLDDVWLC